MSYEDVFRYETRDNGKWKNVEVTVKDATTLDYLMKLGCWIFPLDPPFANFCCITGDCPHETYNECAISMVKEAPIQPGDSIKFSDDTGEDFRVLPVVYAKLLNLKFDEVSRLSPTRGDRVEIGSRALFWVVQRWEHYYGTPTDGRVAFRKGIPSLFVEFDDAYYSKALDETVKEFADAMKAHYQLFQFVCSKMGSTGRTPKRWREKLTSKVTAIAHHVVNKLLRTL